MLIGFYSLADFGIRCCQKKFLRIKIEEFKSHTPQASFCRCKAVMKRRNPLCTMLKHTTQATRKLICRLQKSSRYKWKGFGGQGRNQVEMRRYAGPPDKSERAKFPLLDDPQTQSKCVVPLAPFFIRIPLWCTPSFLAPSLERTGTFIIRVGTPFILPQDVDFFQVIVYTLLV